MTCGSFDCQIVIQIVNLNPSLANCESYGVMFSTTADSRRNFKYRFVLSNKHIQFKRQLMLSNENTIMPCILQPDQFGTCLQWSMSRMWVPIMKN